MNIQPWQIWVVIGIICIVIEIFDPAFFFLSLGIGAIVTALLSFIVSSTPLQLLIFAIVSFLAFLSMRKLGKKVLVHPASDTNVFALKGKTGFVVKSIASENKGYVKIGGEEWAAISADGSPLEQGTRIIVKEIEGNKVIVEKIPPKSE